MKIGIEELKITCTIGTQEEEQHQQQDIFVDIEVETQPNSADDLDDTVNYVLIAELCNDLATKQHYQLLESYAQDVLDSLLDKFNISTAQIKVKKPQAIPTARCATIKIRKEKC